MPTVPSWMSKSRSERMTRITLLDDTWLYLETQAKFTNYSVRELIERAVETAVPTSWNTPQGSGTSGACTVCHLPFVRTEQNQKHCADCRNLSAAGRRRKAAQND